MSILIEPGAGFALGNGGIIRVRGEQTGGAMAVVEQVLRPRAFITPHFHANDVWVNVLAGTVGVLVDDEIATGGPGSWLLKPREVMHAMWNPTDEPARITEVLTPAGSEMFFEELSALDKDDDEGFHAARARHGLRFIEDSPWIEELRKRFGLT